MDDVVIIKRLVLIKNLIALEDEEDLIVQITKLQNLQLTNDVEKIIGYLKEKLYSKAVEEIEKFINFNNKVTFYTDPAIEALRFEAKLLVKQIQELSNEKVELEKLIHQFNVRHHQELGKLILEILQSLKEKSKGTSHEKKAENDYENFHTNYQAAKSEKVASLNKEEEQDLKDKYRKASKICHPDVVNDDQKKIAHKIFMELNSAYEKNDLQRVTEILEELQHGKSFTSKADTANEKLTLIVEIERLRNNFMTLKEEILSIQSSDTFIKIISIKNLDEYFEDKKQHLQAQLNKLKDERESVNKI